MTLPTLAQSEYRMHKRTITKWPHSLEDEQGHLLRGSFGRGLGAMGESKSFKNRHGGEYDRKSFRMIIPIPGRKGQIIEKKSYHFSLSSGT